MQYRHLSWTNFLASQLFNTSLTYSYQLTWSMAYLSRENFVFSLNKSTNFSQTFYYGRRETATTFYRFKLAVTRIQINLGGSCQLTRTSFRYNFLSQCFSRHTNLSYFHDRQLLCLRRHFEQVCFARDSREEFAKGTLSAFPYMGKNCKVIFHWSGIILSIVSNVQGEVTRF